MRYAILFLGLVFAGSCSDFTRASSSPDYLRCMTTSTSTPDVPISSTDSSIFGGSAVSNTNSCTTNPSICATLGTNFSCNTSLGCCDELQPGKCSKSADCASSDKPVCDVANGICVACSTADKTLGNMQCSAYSTAQNDPLSEVLCVGGTCHECLASADCRRTGKGNCNTKTFTCGGCTDDSQCSTSSNICKVDESLLAEPGDSPQSIGDCASAGNVVYVDNGYTGCASGDGSLAKPFCQINTAISTGKPYIRVTGHGSGMLQIYNPVTVSSGQKVVILGPSGGRDTTANQVVIDGVSVTSGGTLTLQDVAVVSTMGAAAAVQCNGSTIFVKRVSIMPVGNQQPKGGIITTGCKVDVEKTKMYGAQGYGLWITGGSGHRIVNNAIIRNGLNGLANQPYGMKLTAVTNGSYAFNTIVGNGQGVQCDSSVAISDSIITSNGADPQLTTNCQQARIVTAAGTLDPTSYMSGGDPKLADSNNSAVIDKAMPDVSVQDDYFGNKRPFGAAYDIGYQEVK